MWTPQQLEAEQCRMKRQFLASQGILAKEKELRELGYLTLRPERGKRTSFYTKKVVKEGLFQKQKGRCAVCKTLLSMEPGPLSQRKYKAHVDHDHETGEVRGLLCGHCNLMIGFAGDAVNVLTSAATYLRKHQIAKNLSSGTLVLPERPTESAALSK